MRTKTSVIEAIDIAGATPTQVFTVLTGSTVPGWRARKTQIAWSFDIVGDHASIKLQIALATPMSLALVCTGETCDLGWVGTRPHLAFASTPTGTRVAVVHGGIPADGAGRDAWRQLFAELAATLESTQIAA
jgi:hypothetical protein